MHVGCGRPFWFDPKAGTAGFSTVGVVIAMLVTLSLVFTGAQVYRVQSVSSEIQEVADAAALASDNVIAEYYLVARVCDAVVLSLSLTGIIVMGVGIAAMCTPLTAKVGTTFIDAGKRVLKARDQFATHASAGLDRLQKALPFLAAVAANRVAHANATPAGRRYLGFAIALPGQGEQVAAGKTGASDELIDTVDKASDSLRKAAEDAEDAAKKAKQSKERAYRADCGASPARCMYERAAALSDLSGPRNPYFSSVDTWGFSVALERAKAYYPRRLALESPTGETVDDQAKSALRKRFYAYASDAMSQGFVRESDDSFEADFPLLPRNVAELEETPLYTEEAYPVTQGEDGQRMMHAWEGCPRAAGSIAQGSLAQWAAGGFEECPACHLTPQAMASVAAASSSIDNGFEYHYRIVAEEAAEYGKAKSSYKPKAQAVRRIAKSLFEDAVAAMRAMASQRISVKPPGRFGVVAVVAAMGDEPADAGFASRFVHGGGSLGTRVAISGATLVEDAPEQGRTAISSILDGVRERGSSRLTGVLDGVMDVWSAVLYAYADGQSRIGEGLDELDSRLSFGSESRLGLWGSAQFAELMESVGLQPAELGAPKPVLVNTGHVLEADGSAFSARLLSVKRAASGLMGNNLLEGAIGMAQGQALSVLQDFDGTVTIAEIEILGPGSPAVPITLTLPASAQEDGMQLVDAVAEHLRQIAGSITGVRQWR